MQSENHNDKQPGLRTLLREDVRVGVCQDKTVLRVGGADSRGGRCHSVVTAEEVRGTRATVTWSVSELTMPKAAQQGNEPNNADGARGRAGRPGETSGAAASDGSTTEDDSAKSSAT